jgi:thiol-disulfide isomerase/thioredoxin
MRPGHDPAFSLAGRSRRTTWSVLTLLLAFAPACFASVIPPHLGPEGLEAYRLYANANMHRAFALAPGGRWGWVGDAVSAEAARLQALESCQSGSVQKCVLYDLNGRLVFDAKAWPGLWGPYATTAEAAKARVGTQPGMRFPALRLTDPVGRKINLGDLRGKIVVLHFWGSWCSPCRKEMPEMQRVAARLGSAVRFVLVQVREDRITARRWLTRQGIRLPLYDSGAISSDDGTLHLADGGPLKDREIAKAFPSTYVLDRHGLVLFSHTGAIHGWSGYIPFLRHAADKGK